MSDTEAEQIHLGLVFEPIADSPAVRGVAPNEGTRKRPAGDRASDVPSASRRRRGTNPDSAPFIRPSFSSTCCVNGIVQPPMSACLLQSPQVFDSGPASSSASSLPTVYRPQVIEPQVHVQMSAMPSTSTVNTMAPVTFRVHTPPLLMSNYSSLVQLTQNRANSYYLNSALENAQSNGQELHSQQSMATHMLQPLLGLRLPTTPVSYASSPLLEVHPRRPPEGSAHPPPIPGFPSQPYLRPVHPAMADFQWESATSPRNLPPHARSYTIRDPSSRAELLLSQFRQSAAGGSRLPPAEAANPSLRTYRRLSDQTIADNSHLQASAQNRLDGPVAIPTLTTEWPPNREFVDNGSMPSHFQSDWARLANGDIPFRAWEAAVLQIFDRMAPQMNLMRLPPKGMPKNEIEQLKSFRLADPRRIMEKVCVVCQYEFERRDHVRVLPCEHHFHVKCVDKWLKTNRTCPICRKSASDSVDAPLSSPVLSPSTSAALSSGPHIAVQVITQVGQSSLPSPSAAGPSA